MNSLHNMNINNEGHIAAMRRIPCNIYTVLYEILGNIGGNIFGIYIDDDFKRIQIYGNDIWTKDDMHALHNKYTSGKRQNTASINGIGIRFVLDRLLEDDDCAEYIIKDSEKNFFKCKIGHFKNSHWIRVNENSDIFDEYKDMIKDIIKVENNLIPFGTLINIPLNNEYSNKLKKLEMKNIKKMFSKFYNRVSNVQIFFNYSELKLNPLCKYSININVKLCWDTKTPNKSSCYNEFLTFSNYKEVLKYFPKLKQNIKLRSVVGKNKIKKKDLENKYEVTKERHIKETFIIRFSIITKEECDEQAKLYGSIDEIRGVQIYYNSRCLTPKPIYKHLGGKQGKDGIGGAIGNKFGGQERFEIELKTKNSLLFNLPQDKTNIKATTRGEKILLFIRYLAELHPTTKNKKKYKTKKQIEDEEKAKLEAKIKAEKKKIAEITKTASFVASSASTFAKQNSTIALKQIEVAKLNAKIIAKKAKIAEIIKTASMVAYLASTFAEKNATIALKEKQKAEYEIHKLQVVAVAVEVAAAAAAVAAEATLAAAAAVSLIRSKLKKRQHIQSQIRLNVYAKNYTIPEIRCNCCNERMFQYSGSFQGLKYKKIHFAHFISNANGGKEIESNLFLCCETCNKKMGTEYAPEFIKKHYSENYPKFKETFTELLEINLREHKINPRNNYTEPIFKF